MCNHQDIKDQYPLDISGLVIARNGMSSAQIKALQKAFISSDKSKKSTFKVQKFLPAAELEVFHAQKAIYVKRLRKLLGTMLK